MSLEEKSAALKKLIAVYDTPWMLGNLSALIHAAGGGHADDQLKKLSSPMRQLYFLAGLLVSTAPKEGKDIQYSMKKWDQIVTLLNEIEAEYDQLFFPRESEITNDNWRRVRQVAMPSFLAYFNQGPLNFEEQRINWIDDLYPKFDEAIEKTLGVRAADLLQFYKNLDRLHQRNFQSYSSPKMAIRSDWRNYIKVRLVNTAPPELQHLYNSEKDIALFHFVADKGIIDRFFPIELVSDELSFPKVNLILGLLTTKREVSDFLYYTATRPGNPLYDKPIVDIGDGLYQVFEVKQVIHAVEAILERICNSIPQEMDKYTEKKGKLLESKVTDLFISFLGPEARVFRSFYVDGCEQDILILWRRYAFTIEAKGYSIREPLRNPDKAFQRIKDDFKKSLGYAYEQSRRVERKFMGEQPLRITDNTGKMIEEIDTAQFDEHFTILVNMHSFGQVQTDLSTLLTLEAATDVYPWAVRVDDLEVFLLTMKAMRKEPLDLIDFLILREGLHGKLICSDECQLCGGFLTRKITHATAEADAIVVTHPDLADIFDRQYRKGMGFRDEKQLAEKQSGEYIFW